MGVNGWLWLRAVDIDGTFIGPARVRQVTLTLADGGEIGVLPGHAPLLARTASGRLRYRIDAGVEEIDVPAGIMVVEPHAVTLIADGFGQVKTAPSASASPA